MDTVFPPNTTTTEHDAPGVAPAMLPPHLVIKELCADLSRSLYSAPPNLDVLDEQVTILNALFNATLAEQLDLSQRRYGEERSRDWLELALKIQKQCMDTVRTHQNADYMDALRTMHVKKIYVSPHPRKTVKRNDEL